MTVPNEQQVLREAYDKCVMVTRLLQSLNAYSKVARDELVLKASQLADAIHHYIVPKE